MVRVFLDVAMSALFQQLPVMWGEHLNKVFRNKPTLNNLSQKRSGRDYNYHQLHLHLQLMLATNPAPSVYPQVPILRETTVQNLCDWRDVS